MTEPREIDTSRRVSQSEAFPLAAFDPPGEDRPSRFSLQELVKDSPRLDKAEVRTLRRKSFQVEVPGGDELMERWADDIKARADEPDSPPPVA